MVAMERNTNSPTRPKSILINQNIKFRKEFFQFKNAINKNNLPNGKSRKCVGETSSSKNLKRRELAFTKSIKNSQKKKWIFLNLLIKWTYNNVEFGVYVDNLPLAVNHRQGRDTFVNKLGQCFNDFCFRSDLGPPDSAIERPLFNSSEANKKRTVSIPE
jgi:hypothetical protein